MTVIDIFEALTASDRPYKKAMDKKNAFDVLHKMADGGKIDKKVLKLFEAAVKSKSEDPKIGHLFEEVKS